MGTNPSVAEEDTTLAALTQSMNAKLNREPVVINPNLVHGDLEFATSRDRCLYIGTSTRDQRRWLEEHPGCWRRIEDVLREAAALGPPLKNEIEVGAASAGPNSQTSSSDVRNESHDEDDTDLVGALAGDCSLADEPASPPTSLTEPVANETMEAKLPNRAKARMSEVTESKIETIPPAVMRRKRGRGGGRQLKKQKRPISKAGRRRSIERMLIVLDSLAEIPILSAAARKAGIHRKTLEYWMKRSEAGDEGYDIEWRGETWKFHEHCETAMGDAEDNVVAAMWNIAMGVVYKNDEFLLSLGYKGPYAYLRDENGDPVIETVGEVNPKMLRFFLELRRPDEFGKNRKMHVPCQPSVLVVGATPKKPKNSTATAASIRVRKWKAASRMIQEANTLSDAMG